jgi:predicted nucleic acid-binding protein
LERVFLDANVLFSAAYPSDTRLRELWTLKEVKLVTSAYAIEEARRNISNPEQREELEKLIGTIEIVTSSPAERRLTVNLPEKDRPIVSGAIEARASHLITGDITHFGKCLGKKIEGVLILTPSQYLLGRKKK